MTNEDAVLTITDEWGAEVSVWFTKDGWVTLTATYWGNDHALLSPSNIRELRDFLTAKLEAENGE